MASEDEKNKTPETVRVDIEAAGKTYNPIIFPISTTNTEIVTTSFAQLGILVPYEQRMKAIKIVDIARSSQQLIRYIEFGLKLEANCRLRLTIGHK